MENYLNKNGLCNYCSEFKVKKHEHTKEIAVKTILENNNIDFTHDKIVIGGCGSRLRPDFVIDAATHLIIVEVDENQHRQYNTQCDEARTVNLFHDFGGIPLVFIRYNPDNYKKDGKIIRSKTGRHRRLLDTIDQCRHKPESPITYVQLFYDGDDGTNLIQTLDLNKYKI